MKTALITGASVGIGYELAKVYAEHNYKLILTARNQQQLEELAHLLRDKYGAEAHVITADLSVAGSAETLVAEVSKRSLSVDVLINNAGFGMYGQFAQLETAKELELLQVNIVALTHLTRLLLPQMIERRQGNVINIASTAAFVPGPGMAIYYASKAYVLSFSEALEAELSDTGVKVSVVCPGPTESEFSKRAGMDSSRLFRSMSKMTSAQVALDTYSGMVKGETLIVPGFSNQLLVATSRLAPRKAITYMVKRINQPG